MATYLMFGSYSPSSVKAVSAERTKTATALIKKNGGELKAGYALLGEHDLVLVADFADVEQAMKTSVALTKLLGISFKTSPAVTVTDFDKIVGSV